MKVWGGPRWLWSVAVGVVMIVWGVYSRQQSLHSRHWPTVPGIVLTSRMGTGSRHSTSPTFQYRYRIEGRTYTGELISYDRWLLSSDDFVRRYPEGSAVDVHYDPADPAKAVLEPGPGLEAGLKIVLGIAFFAVAWWQDR